MKDIISADDITRHVGNLALPDIVRPVCLREVSEINTEVNKWGERLEVWSTRQLQKQEQTRLLSLSICLAFNSDFQQSHGKHIYE